MFRTEINSKKTKKTSINIQRRSLQEGKRWNNVNENERAIPFGQHHHHNVISQRQFKQFYSATNLYNSVLCLLYIFQCTHDLNKTKWNICNQNRVSALLFEFIFQHMLWSLTWNVSNAWLAHRRTSVWTCMFVCDLKPHLESILLTTSVLCTSRRIQLDFRSQRRHTHLPFQAILSIRLT